MYEKVWLQRHTRSAMSYYYAPPEIELCRRLERLPWFARAEGCTRPESPARTLWQPPLLRRALG